MIDFLFHPVPQSENQPQRNGNHKYLAEHFYYLHQRNLLYHFYLYFTMYARGQKGCE